MQPCNLENNHRDPQYENMNILYKATIGIHSELGKFAEDVKTIAISDIKTTLIQTITTETKKNSLLMENGNIKDSLKNILENQTLVGFG